MEHEVRVHTPMDYFKAEMFLIAHSEPTAEIDDGLWLKCVCGDPDNCPRWEGTLWLLAKSISVPQCLVKEFEAECGNLITELIQDDENAW